MTSSLTSRSWRSPGCNAAAYLALAIRINPWRSIELVVPSRIRLCVADQDRSMPVVQARHRTAGDVPTGKAHELTCGPERPDTADGCALICGTWKIVTDGHHGPTAPAHEALQITRREELDMTCRVLLASSTSQGTSGGRPCIPGNAALDRNLYYDMPGYGKSLPQDLGRIYDVFQHVCQDAEIVALLGQSGILERGDTNVNETADAT